MELAEEVRIPILYEDRSVLAIDKPAGWLIGPTSWDRALQNLQRAIDSSLAGREFWAKSRNLKFLKFVHRLDEATSGVLLFVKSPGAMGTYSGLFQTRAVKKQYLAVVEGEPQAEEWSCDLPVDETDQPGRMRVDRQAGKPSLTHFRLLAKSGGRALIEVEPVTGRTHQIRVHLEAQKLPIVGDELYGSGPTRLGGSEFPMGLRAIELRYQDPFLKKPVRIRAPRAEFVQAFGFNLETLHDTLEEGKGKAGSTARPSRRI